MHRWEHEITMGGSGNGEFEMYHNDRTNSYVKDGVLYLQPTLSAEKIGEDKVKHGYYDLYSAPDYCKGDSGNCAHDAGKTGVYQKPLMSARLKTKNTFAFKYGKLEVKA